MPFLALNRKNRGGQIDWNRPGVTAGRPTHPQNARSMAVSWPAAVMPPHAIVVTFCVTLLHGLVIGSATALRRNPGNVAVRVLHVAGFAVNAILGVDLEARA